MTRWTVFALALAVTGCSMPPSGHLFRTSLSNGDGYAPVSVVLADQTDLVTGIEAAPAGRDAPPTQATIRPDPNDTTAFIVTWMGGLCASDIALSFGRTGSGYALHLEGHKPELANCSMVGIGRDLRVRTAAPISLELIGVVGSE